MTVDEVIRAFRLFALPEIEALLPAIVQDVLSKLNVDKLIMMSEAVVREIEARSEKDAMAASVDAIDQQVDMAEDADIKLAQTGKPY